MLSIQPVKCLETLLILGVLISLASCRTESPAELDSSLGSLDSVVSGLQQSKDGFSFPNYGNTVCKTPATKLTPRAMETMFGGQVCKSGNGDSCTLTAPAQVYMGKINNLLGAGHCAGFSGLSYLIASGRVDIANYQAGQTSPAGTIYDLGICSNTPLQEELAIQASQQFNKSVQSRMIWPENALEFLSLIGKSLEGLKNRQTDTKLYSIGIFQPGPSKGHAVTPLAIENQGDDNWNVVIYDSNYPGTIQKMVVNTKNNTVNYTSAINPDEPLLTYNAKAAGRKGSVLLVPVEYRPSLECPFCNGVGNRQEAPNSSSEESVEIFLDNDGHNNIVIENKLGQKIGRLRDGTFINTFPNVEPFALIGASSALVAEDEGYLIPAGGDLTVTLNYSGTENATSPQSVSAVGPGYTLSVNSIMSAKDQVDSISFGEGGSRVTHTGNSEEIPDLELSFSTQEGSDFIFSVSPNTDSGGATTELNFDPIKGELSFNIETNDGSNASYDLSIRRINSETCEGCNKEDVFGHFFDERTGRQQTLESGDTLTFHYDEWGGTGQPIVLDITKENGTTTTTTLSNQTDSAGNPISPTTSGGGGGGGGGTVNTPWGTTGIVTTSTTGSALSGNAVAIQSDGKVVVAGTSGSDILVARYNTNGTLDTSFGTAATGKVLKDINSGTDIANGIAIQSDGKIVVVGETEDSSSNKDFVVLRYNTNGTLDTSFDTDGVYTYNSSGAQSDTLAAVVIQSDGKIVAAGTSNNDFAVTRLSSAGVLDTTFNSSGTTPGIVTTDMSGGANDDAIKAMVLQTDGKILVAGPASNGSNNDFAIARYTSSGVLDTGFNSTGKVTLAITSGQDDTARAIAISSDQATIVVGGYTNNGTDNQSALAMYNSSGGLITTFGPSSTIPGTVIYGTTGTASDDSVYAISILSDGSILSAGQSFNGNDADSQLRKYSSTGALVTAFGTSGIVTTNISSVVNATYAMAVQSDAKIILAGKAELTSDSSVAVIRYRSNGALDAQ